MTRKALWAERIMIALPQGHPLLAKDRLHWVDLRKHRFIISEQDPGPDLASVLLARLSEPSSSPELTMFDISRENVLTMVSAANYATLTTDAAMGSTAPGVVLRNIQRADRQHGPARVCRLYWRSDNENPALARLLDVVSRRYPGDSVASSPSTS